MIKNKDRIVVTVVGGVVQSIHSNNPNISFGGVATRDIAKGEELTYDYRKIDTDFKKF